MKRAALSLGICWCLLTASAEAHFSITDPPPADTADDGGKGAPPCGPSANSGSLTAAQGGHALVLKIDELVFHPGFYRVALALNSPSELPPDNVVKDKAGNVLSADSIGLSDTADYQTTPVFPVLADHLWAHDMPDQELFETQLTLPNVNCDKCTLQVIEFMSNSNSNLGGGYFYHHCANLKITADPALPAFVPPVNMGGGGAGPTGGAAGTAGTSAGAAGTSAGAAGTSAGAAGNTGTAGSGESTGGAAGGGLAGSGSTNGGSGGASGGSGGSSGSSGSSGKASGPSVSSDAGGCSFSRSCTTPAAIGFGWFAFAGLGACARRRRSRRAT